MAYIKTVNGDTFTVKESKEDIDKEMHTLESQETGLLSLHLAVTFTKYAKGAETYSRKYEPASFVRANIIMYS